MPDLPLPGPELRAAFGEIDIYLFDQLLRGRFDRRPRVLDAGCGDGFYLGGLQREARLDAHGVDISIPAVDAAARRYSDCEWVVANADRALPYTDESFSMVLSITGRMIPRR